MKVFSLFCLGFLFLTLTGCGTITTRHTVTCCSTYSTTTYYRTTYYNTDPYRVYYIGPTYYYPSAAVYYYYY